MVPIVIIKLFVVAVFISTSSGQNITTQTTTTSDPQCMDMVANCDVYTKAACNPPYQSWAIKNCRKFCDLCGTTIAASTHAPCVDLVNTCEQHGKSVCQGIFLPWAQMNCRKYCNICGYCASRPCQNKGLCIDGATGYACTCPPGFVGKNCEIELFNTMTTTAATNCVDGTIVRCSDSHVCMTPELAKYCPLTCKICSPCVDSPLVNCNKAVCGTDPVLSGYCPATCGTCGKAGNVGIVG